MNEKTEGKTLVFSFDGTGNEPADAEEFEVDESISNVFKLHILMGGGFKGDCTSTKTPAGDDQKTFYYTGIGTHDSQAPGIVTAWFCTKIKRGINQAFAPKRGDAGEILQQARQDFDSADYQPGDTVAVFGFSRGAALARMFAATLLKDGACENIAFLGVFDTVAAMGEVQTKGEEISSDVVFENGTLHDGVQRAVHLVSLDENRIPFRPTLINRDAENPGRILEVWFPGVHSDVGGGYWFDGLSDSALEFMIAECRETLDTRIRIFKPSSQKIAELLAAQPELADLDVDDVAVYPLVNGPMHEHRRWKDSWMGKKLLLAPREVCIKADDKPIDGFLPIVHESVMARFREMAAYRPAALRGVAFRLLRDGEVEAKVRHGVSGLRAPAK